MLSDENDNFVRDFEVDPLMKLSEFHDFIIKSIGYDDCMASFFTADEEWQRCREFTLMDMGDTGYEGEDAPLPMDKTSLAEIIVADYSPSKPPKSSIISSKIEPAFESTASGSY